MIPTSSPTSQGEWGRSKIPRSVIVGLVLTIVLDTIVQIAWKMAVSRSLPGSSTGAMIFGALSSPYFYVVMLAFGAQLFNWMRVLARADLSFAQPFTALSYVTVLTFSSHTLHETVTVFKMGGIALILLGVFFISRTPSITTEAIGRPSDSDIP